MASLFIDWMVYRDVATLLRLLEAADYFDPPQYNAVFDGEIEKLLDRLPDGEARRQAAQMKGFDWSNYIVRSLARAGFRDDDAQQEAFQQIAIRLLVEPGKLFRGYDPQRHGPLERRFRRSVWNSIRNIAEKSRNRQRWMHSADPAVMADRWAGRAPYNNIIEEFRRLVAERLGKMALAILDARLAGQEMKELAGQPGFTRHSLKRDVQAIKELARGFGDPSFSRMVARAMEMEAETVEKRRQAMAARRVG